MSNCRRASSQLGVSLCKDGPMFTTARVVVAAACVLAAAAGCSGDDDPAPDPTGVISTTTMRGALLQAADVGPTWTTPEESADPQVLVSICGGTTPAPTAPPGAEVIS